MANQITDNRTLLFDGDSINADNGGDWDTLGSTSETLDEQIFIEGTGSIGEQFSDSVRTLIWDNGTTMDMTDLHVYVWVNCGIVGLLDLKANGGFAIRFTGPSSANFLEYYVGGSDSWPTAVAGGWVQFVVDLAATASNTGGTPPAKSAIQGVGISGVTATVMTKVSDNTWIDACWTLAPNTPGIIVEGRNGGSTDWNSADIFTQLTQAAGLFLPSAGGSWKINAPIQFAINDTSTHGFTDTNAVWLWDAQEWAAADLYGISALGNSGGTTNVTFGIKSGTGDAATGAQGLVISAAATGVRWFMDFNDPNLDAIGFYGCAFRHGSDFLLDDAAVSAISTTYLDCTSAEVHNSEQLRCTIVDANTADGVAFMRTDDINDIKFTSFEFSDGHAIELDAATPTAQSNVGNLFSGYTNSVDSTDAAILNSAAGALTITNSLGSNLATNSYRNTGGGSVSIVAGVPITLTFLDDSDGSPIEGLAVIFGTAPGATDMIDNLLTDVNGEIDVTYTGTVPDEGEGFAAKGSEEPVYVRRAIGGTVAASTGLVATIRMSPD